MPARVRAGIISGMTLSSPAFHPRLLSPLFLWQGGWLSIMSSLQNQPHQHVAASLLVGLTGPIRVTVDERRFCQRVVLVPPEASQSLSSDGPVAIMHLDPDERAWRTLACLGEPDAALQAWCCTQMQALSEDDTGSAVVTLLTRLRALAEAQPLDARVASACRQLRESDVLPSLESLAAQAGLSASRFRHLFRDELGVTFKRFQLHLKCQRALALWHSGMNLTELAVAAGFYDQPHLNRTLRAMFDALPSRYARSLPVQVVHLGTV